MWYSFWVQAKGYGASGAGDPLDAEKLRDDARRERLRGWIRVVLSLNRRLPRHLRSSWPVTAATAGAGLFFAASAAVHIYQIAVKS